MNGRKRLVSLAALALAVGCSDGGTVTDPQVAEHVGGPAFAIEVGSATTAHNNGSAGFLDIGAPPVNAGDLLIAQVVAVKLNGPSKSPAQYICPPAGWTSIRRTNNKKNNEESDIVLETFRYVATSSAAATTHRWTFRSGSCSGSALARAASGGITRFTDVDADDPIDAAAGISGTSSPPFATPGVTTTVDGARVLRFMAAKKDSRVTFTGITTLYSIGSSAGDARMAAAGEFSQSEAGPTGAGAFRFGPQGSDDWVGQTIALRPANGAPAPTIFMKDDFGRTLAGSWGNAEIGGDWFESTDGGVYSVNGGAGRIAIPGGIGPQNVVGRDPSSYGLNVAGLASFSIDAIPDDPSGDRFHTVQAYGRRNDQLVPEGNNYYRFRVRAFRSGTMDIRLEHNVAGTLTLVGTSNTVIPATFTPGFMYWIRWEVFGTSPATTARMRVWQDGSAEPDWQASGVFDLPGLDLPGTSGFRVQNGSNQSATVTYSFDNFVYQEIN